MKIGQLAEASGVHVETIRYYQQLGLMPRPARLRGAVRRYDNGAVSRLRFIKRAQALGFSLDEVKLRRKLDLVEHKMADLRAMQDALQKLVRACGSGKDGRGCPIIENLCRE